MRYPRLAGLAILGVILMLLNVVMYPMIPGTIKISSSHYHHDLRPNLENPRKWGDLTYNIVTNSLGFKDKAVRSVTLNSDKHRILFIGDSFTEGIGASFEETFVGRYAATLDPTRYEVLNAGVSSYSPKLYFHKLRYLLEEVGLKVDEVRAFVDISDVQDEIIYEGWEPGEPDFWESVDSVLFTWVWMYNAIRRSDHLFNSYDRFYTTRGTWPEDDAVYEKWGKEGLERAVGYMDKLHDLCKRHGVSLSMAIYPWPEQILAGRLDSRAVEPWKAFAVERGIPLTDYFPVFMRAGVAKQTVETYFISGDCHWNLEGHALVAEHVPFPLNAPKE